MLIHHHLLKEVDLASLKSDVDILDIDELKTVPTRLHNLKPKRKLNDNEIKILLKMNECLMN